MNAVKIVKELKENEQDFEWYPTTSEILKPIARDIKSEKYNGCSILDIGAGNGQVFNILYDMINVVDEHGQNSFSMTKYAIEKSRILIDKMPDDVFVIGSDFHKQTLIDKKVDVIFCNPPYKEYLDWMEKLLKEANAGLIYLIVPERWKDNKKIVDILEKRTNKKDGYKILGSFDFNDSEYRQARAKVDIIKIKLSGSSYGRDNLITDPFDLWFNENFKIQADKESHSSDFETLKQRQEELKALINGQNLIERLEELYLQDMDKLLATYKCLETLDPALLAELDIKLDNVKEALKLKIEGLKNLYWSELFDNLEVITGKLTSSSRKTMLETLNSNTNIDFSSDNAYAVIIWAIKNSNKYFDSQLVAVYKKLTMPDAVKNYKSNKNILNDSWRYIRDTHTHYTLDYRIVTQQYSCFDASGYSSYNHPNGLCQAVHDFINDISVIAKNLGFDVMQNTYLFEWTAGQQKEFYCIYENKRVLFMQVRCYKNGNVHFKFNQQFMTAFNIEASRLNGWIRNAQDLNKETDIPQQEISAFFLTNHKFKSIQLLEGITDNEKDNL